MDLKAIYLSETCSDPIEYLHQLRQATEPIGGDTEYCENGELVEYDVAVEAIKKANDAFIEKAEKWFEDLFIKRLEWEIITYEFENVQSMIEDFKNYIKGE